MAKFYFLGQLNKTPSDGTLLGRTSRRFLWCWLWLLLLLLLFYSLEVFTFPGYFSLPPALHPSFSGPWRPPPALTLRWLLSVALSFARLFTSQFYRERYGFEWAIFSHRCFLPYAPSPTFLEQFVTQMRVGTPHPGSSSVPGLTELSLPADAWAWTTHIVVTRPLIYQFCQWATKYRAKI